jgi:hypothetical protein
MQSPRPRAHCVPTGTRARPECRGRSPELLPDSRESPGIQSAASRMQTAGAMRTARSLMPLTLLLLVLSQARCGGTVTTATTCTSGCVADASPSPDGSPSAADASPACNPPVPNAHQPTQIDCSTTRPPGYNVPSDAGPGDLPGSCTSDSQCTTGTNPRCTPVGRQAFETECTSDACATDAQCGSGSICQCGTAVDNGGRSANVCMAGNCQIDSDCGPGGYCSPTLDTQCGPYDGIVGYFCHRPADQCTKDECTNDSDCPPNDAGFGPSAGYCAWEPTTAKWTCAYTFCSG